ncbi:MAG: hypothetical protein IJE25_08310 [Clostridia bacterium]|nr:hypothetical protein [Clostridia bacterium]
MLPYLRETQKSRSFIRAFGGYNNTPTVSENEMANGYNFSSDAYPALSVRDRRGFEHLGSEEIVAVLCESDTRLLLGYVTDEVTDEARLVLMKWRADTSAFGKVGDVGEPVEDADYRLVRIGRKVLIYPCGYVYDTVTEELEEYTQTHEIESFEIVNVIKTDDGIFPIKDSKEAAAVGEYYICPSFNETEGYGVKFYEKKNEESGTDGDLVVNESDVRLKVTYRADFYGEPQEPKLEGIFDRMIDGLFKLRDGYEENVEYEEGIILNGYMSFEKITVTNGVANVGRFNKMRLRVEAKDKKIDHIVECQNRLWGCRSDGDINEIFCTRLGSYKDWSLGDSLSDVLSADSAWVVPVGIPGAFTGSCVIDNNPIFFKQNAILKVYPSAQGAHQIHTITARGVQLNSHNSVARVGDYIFYKTTRDVVCFDGSNISTISSSLGNKRYKNAVGGADGDNYVMYCESEDGEGAIFVFDTKRKIWHRELPMEDDNPVLFILNDPCEYVTLNAIYSRHAQANDDYESKIPFMLESGNIGMDSPDHKYLCRMDMRLELSQGSNLAVYIQYDSDGVWKQVARLSGTTARPQIECVSILPQRCDHFRYRLSGIGRITLHGIAKVFEETEN